jgi:Zn-dependent M28 family amino/carboxypeptidase
VLLAACLLAPGGCQASPRFSGQRAYRHVEHLCKIGPRPVGSEANQQAANYIATTVERYGWQTERQTFGHKGELLCNVVASKGQGPLIIIGAHYDTRPLADRDPTDRSRPVMGANDGGSGTAVLLELARVLDPAVTEQATIWLAFFDGEDRGEIDGWDWCVGSRHMAQQLQQQNQVRPAYVLIVDMVGDADQRIYYEWSSTLWLQEKLWGIAADLGYSDHFIATHRYTILDDHSPFLERGIPAAVMIDFDYPYWHTRYDTADKVSVDSLQRVGDVVEALLEGEPFATSVEERQTRH